MSQGVGDRKGRRNTRKGKLFFPFLRRHPESPFNRCIFLLPITWIFLSEKKIRCSHPLEHESCSLNCACPILLKKPICLFSAWLLSTQKILKALCQCISRS